METRKQTSNETKIGLERLLQEKLRALSAHYHQEAIGTFPILGTRFDKNNALIAYNLIAIFILVALSMSLVNEARCVRAILPIVGDDIDKIRAVMNSHVFSRPKHWRTFWLLFFVPAVLPMFRLYNDIFSPSEHLPFYYFAAAESLFGRTKAFVFFAVEVGTILVLVACCIICVLNGRRLDQRLIELSKKSPGNAAL